MCHVLVLKIKVYISAIIKNQNIMKDQKIFRVSTFGNRAAIASVTDDNKVWVRYYNGIKQLTDIPNGGFNYRFIKEVTEQVENWATENNYTLWSF